MQRLALTLLLAAVMFASPAGTASAQQPAADAVATRQYSVALGFQKKKIYDQAEQRWVKFIAAYPKHPRLVTATYHLGVCQIRLNKFAEAAATFRDIAAKYPKFKSLDSARFNLGLALYGAAEASKKPEDYKAAVAAFVDVAAKHPDSQLAPQAMYYQAECLCLANDLNAAVPIYQQAIQKYAKSPLVPQLYFSLGATLQDLKKDADAAAAMKTLLDKYPKDPLANDARLRFGLSLFEQKKFAEAGKLFAQAAAAKGFENADFAMMKHAQTLFEQNNLPAAAAQYESLPKKFKESKYIGAALLAAGKCRYRSKQYPPAQRQFAAVVAKKGAEAPEAAYWLGRTLLQLKRPPQALQTLDKAIAAYPKSELLPLLQFGRVEAISAIANRRPEAVKLFAQFADQHPDHEKAAAARHRAALTAYQLDDLTTAQKQSEAFLANAKFAKHPLTADVLVIAAESFLHQDPSNSEKAEALFRRVVGEFPQHALAQRAQVGIGSCLYGRKQYDPAIQHLTSVAGALKDPALLAESRLLLGRCQLDAGRPKQAVPLLRSTLQAQPNWPHADEVLFVLAVSLRADNQLDASIAELIKLNSAHPKSAYRDQAFYQLGEILLTQKKWDPSIAAYQTVLATPNSRFLPGSLYGIAAAHFEKAAYGPAVANLDKLLAAHAKSEPARQGQYLRGICRLRLKQFANAVPDLTAYAALQPPPANLNDAKFALARAQLGLKQFDPAIAGLKALLTAQPAYPRIDDVYYELGFAYLDANKGKEAADTFQALVAKSPASPRAAECWYRIGAVREQSSQWKDAADAYGNGLKSAKEAGLKEKLRYKLALAQYKQDLFAEATQTIQALLKEAPAGELQFASKYLLGESLFHEKKYDDAQAQLAAVIDSKDAKAKEFQAPALYRSAICAANLKNWPLSEQRYAALVEGFPKFEQLGEARYGWGVALQSQQKFDPARTVFKTVTESEPDTETAAKSWFMMGQCWFAEKRYAEAIDCFSEVAFGFKHKEWQPLSLFEAGRCYVQLDDKPAAKKMLAAVVSDFPEHPRAKDAKTILDGLNK